MMRLFWLLIFSLVVPAAAVAGYPKDACGYPTQGVHLNGLRQAAAQGTTREACVRDLVQKILQATPEFEGVHVDHKITGWFYDYFTADNGLHGWLKATTWQKKNGYVCAVSFPNPHPPPSICKSWVVPVKIVLNKEGKEVGRTSGKEFIFYYNPKFEMFDASDNIVAAYFSR